MRIRIETGVNLYLVEVYDDNNIYKESKVFRNVEKMLNWISVVIEGKV